jgi:hypothetical protein
MRAVRALAVLLFLSGCSDEEPARRKPQSFGTEIYALVCDRVGAQAFREDLSGESFRQLCHADSNGGFASKVNVAALPPITGPLQDVKGGTVSVEEQEERRAKRVARVEALAARRDDLIPAFDALVPDESIAVRCPKDGKRALGDELTEVLGRMSELYLDERLPEFTRALGAFFGDVEHDDETLKALVRLDARDGYRPAKLDITNSLLAYPRILPFGGAALRAVPRPAIENLLTQLSKAETDVALPRALLLDPVFEAKTAIPVVRRDPRGVAAVALRDGKVPAPFVDADADGLPDVDDQGHFVGAKIPAPFGSKTAGRDALGRALGADGKPLYVYLDAGTTPLASVLRGVRRSLVPNPKGEVDPALFGITATMPAFFGDPAADLAHAAGVLADDPAVDEMLAAFGKLAREEPALVTRVLRSLSAGLAATDAIPAAKISAKATLGDDLIDFLGEVSETPDLLEDLIAAFSDTDASKLGAALADLAEHRDVLTYARDPSNKEAYGTLNGPLSNLTTGKLADAAKPLVTDVDRAKPDTGENQSELQRLFQVLHDVRGLAICNKADAVVHLQLRWPPESPIGVSIDYPSKRGNILTAIANDAAVKAACTFVGAPSPPDHAAACGLLRIRDVGSTMMTLAAGTKEPLFEIRDPCLAKIAEHPALALVGSKIVDPVLDASSGIRGLSPVIPALRDATEPNFGALARMLAFDGSDGQYPKTDRFLSDLFDPLPTTQCPAEPFTDSDGATVQLRSCRKSEDTLRARDGNALFPAVATGLLSGPLQPLAQALLRHQATDLFVRFADVLHQHWGSEAPPQAGGLPARQSSEVPPQAGRLPAGQLTAGSGYEPALAAWLRSDALPALAALSKKTEPRVVAGLVRALAQPSHWTNLRARGGQSFVLRRDGTRARDLTPLRLVWSAFGKADARLDKLPDAQARRDDASRGLRAVLEILTDPELLAHAADVLRAHKGERWLAIDGPLPKAVVDVLDPIRGDARGRLEAARLLAYLVDSKRLQTSATALVEALDLLPLSPAASKALMSARPVAGAAAGVMAGFDDASCTDSIDPNNALSVVLRKLATPLPNGKTPLDVLLSAVSGVNRVDPSRTGDLAPADMANIAGETREFLLDPKSGLERIYEVMRRVAQP